MLGGMVFPLEGERRLQHAGEAGRALDVAEVGLHRADVDAAARVGEEVSVPAGHLSLPPRGVPALDVAPVLGHGTAAVALAQQHVPEAVRALDASREAHAHAADGDGLDVSPVPAVPTRLVGVVWRCVAVRVMIDRHPHSRPLVGASGRFVISSCFVTHQVRIPPNGHSSGALVSSDVLSAPDNEQ